MAFQGFVQNKIPIKLKKTTVEVWEEDLLDGQEVMMNDYDVDLLRAIKWFQSRINKFIDEAINDIVST